MATFPRKKRRSPNFVLLLGHRLRRRPSNKTTLFQSRVFAGIILWHDAQFKHKRDIESQCETLAQH